LTDFANDVKMIMEQPIAQFYRLI